MAYVSINSLRSRGDRQGYSRQEVLGRKDRMEDAARLDGRTQLRRIDWIGEGYMFKGLYKDEGFARSRLLPGSEECEDTFVVKTGMI